MKSIQNIKDLYRIYTFKSFCLLLSHRLIYKRRKDVILELRNGLMYSLNLFQKEHTPIAEIYAAKSYEGTFNRDWVETIIDVGANVGIYAILIAKVYPNSRVHALEPCKDTYKKMLKNIKLNNITNIKAHNFGLFNQTKTSELFKSSKNSLISSIFEDKVPEKGLDVEEIQLISAYEFVQEHSIKSIDIIKLDCEGAEYHILRDLEINDKIKDIRYITIDIDERREQVEELLERNNISLSESKISYLIDGENIN